LNLKTNSSGREEHVFYIPPSLAETLFGTSLKTLNAAAEKSRKGRYSSIKKIPSAQLSYKVESFEEKVESENVLGYVEGLEKPDEVVIVSAHYDHVGIINGEIYNGADDNGSGTSAVLELAEAFSLAKKNGLGPKKSVLFLLFTGEEKGLLGSRYYTENPVFPLDKTIADFNIDMIGRIDDKYVDDPGYVYLIGSDKISKELHEISEQANEEHIGLHIDYTYNSDSDPNRFYYRSDQYNFAKNGIPVIFYFTGVHKDYHKPTDDVDKILFDRMERITRLAFYTIWEVANKDEKLSTY
jgi:Zn-dependent M28 family amino/carboxypeptidase